MKTSDQPINHTSNAPPNLSADARDSWWSRSGWLVVLGIAAAATLLVYPYDGPIARAMSAWASESGGDLRRELSAWQQYGQGLFIAVLAVVIWRLDPAGRRRLLDLGLCVGLAKLVAQGGKMLIGRPRPRPEFADPQTFIGPLGKYPVPTGDGGWRLVNAWRTGGVDLWSMPSSHTLMAFAVSAFLARVYPRLAIVVFPLAALVACGRVLFGAHWPTDVIVGAGAGYAIGSIVTSNYLGVRLLDWLWVRLVDRRATPAYPSVRIVREPGAKRAR